MKLDYTSEQIERWRDRVYRRTPRLAVSTKRQALDFINNVGFCFAFKSENSELPCLWHATCGVRQPVPPEHTHNDPYLSFVWRMKEVLPAERKIYYGKLLKRRPTMISLEYLPHFYVLSRRDGTKDEYLKEFARGRLSPLARDIMDSLSDSSPQLTKGLKLAVGKHGARDRGEFDKAITELQTRMFLVKVGEEHEPFSFVWAPLRECFPAQIRKARRVTPEMARLRILEKYFQNQLIGTVSGIQRLFRWSKQEIYQTIGRLVQGGIVTGNVRVEGKNRRFYCLVELE